MDKLNAQDHAELTAIEEAKAQYCGTFLKCNGAEGCKDCIYEEDSFTDEDLHPRHPDNN